MVIVFTLVLTMFLWAVIGNAMRVEPSAPFEMDSNSGRHSFHAFLAIYRQIYAGIFIFGSILAMVAAHGSVCRILLALSAVYALFTVLWITFCYEGYQHARYQSVGGRSTYTGWKYALTLTLGAMSPILFAIGLLIAAYAQ